MTKLLEKVLSEASKLPDSEQEAFAEWRLEELESELRWQQAFAKSPDLLARMADEALAEHRAGRTQKLDPETL